MTTSSGELFELCKRVYEATGWDESENVWYANGGDVSHESPLLSRRMVFDKPLSVPLYTSDYLLEKLPFRTKYTRGDGRIAKGWCYLVLTYADNGQSVATYANRNKEWIEPFYSDTSLKALLKLTLELHEDGLL